MRTLVLAVFVACAATAWAVDPGATGRGGDVLTPGTEQNLGENAARDQRAAEYRPKLKPTGIILAGLAAGMVGLTLVSRRRHRGRGEGPRL